MFLILTAHGGRWLVDSGTSRRIVDDGAGLLASLGDLGPRVDVDGPAGAVRVDVERLDGGWLCRAAGLSVLVSEGSVSDADRVWSKLTVQQVSANSLGERLAHAVDRVAYGGESDDLLHIELFGESIDLTRGQLRQVSRAGSLLSKIGRAISIHPDTKKGGG